jgi:hypothetical protein
MSQRLSTLEEPQREMCASMGFETPEPIIYPPLPPPVVEGLWAWYHNANGEDKDKMKTMMTMTRSRKNRSEDRRFSFCLFGV